MVQFDNVLGKTWWERQVFSYWNLVGGGYVGGYVGCGHTFFYL
ncbi:hypothetical protein [Anaerobacillus arseniciselenatis]|nr:hypothetical protein [Anaerobacillus arseniciselenatis]